MDTATDLGRNPASKHQIQPENGDDQANAGWDCRTLAREGKFLGANGDREKFNFIFPVQLTTSRIGNLTRLIHTLAICVTMHAYIERHPGLWHSGGLERDDVGG